MNDSPAYSRPWWVLTLLPLLLAGVFAKYRSDSSMAREHFEAGATTQSAEAGQQLERAFSQIYRGLRTIARLPGVRAIDRYAEHFDADARTSVQEIYNNLATNVAMSEVYIVPLDLEPDAVDPHTQQPGAPILTYDELIVGKPTRSRPATPGGPEVEIEIFEYRLMKQQLAWLREHCADESSVQGLDFPALCGPEVVTCDNSRYSAAKPRDADRSGLVYSVPFFAPDGKLKGCISGVILTHALSDLLPDAGYALTEPGYHYVAGANQPGTWSASLAKVQAGEPDPELAWSQALELGVRDEGQKWLLWSGRPQAQLEDVPEMRAARQFAIGGALISLLSAGGLFGFLCSSRRHRIEVEAQNRSLESRVHERTGELEAAQQRQRETADAEARRAGELEAQIESFLPVVHAIEAGDFSKRFRTQGTNGLARIARALDEAFETLEGSRRRELEASEREAQRARELEQRVDVLLEIVGRAAEGELNQEFAVSGSDGVGRIGEGLRRLLSDLRGGIARIATTSRAGGLLRDLRQRQPHDDRLGRAELGARALRLGLRARARRCHGPGCGHFAVAQRPALGDRGAHREGRRVGVEASRRRAAPTRP
ncbi:MAG: hypothetical protein IPJ19_01440 [Planctomycetes bacterium]|nr:hypothetical protein [Planctomycetota bacterium]